MNTQEVGFVKSIKDFLVHLDGLPTVKINDLVQSESGVRGWVNSLTEKSVEILILDDGEIQPGDVFKRTGQKLTVPVGQFLLSRSINPLGVPIDGKGVLAKTANFESFELDQPARGINQREFIDKQFDTGITLIDSLVPLGKGQRELIMGDARCGKTDFLINTILNQKNTNTICIFASIGKPVAEVRTIIDALETNKALDHTVVIAASSSDLAPLIFLTPLTALTVAEYFQKSGRDVLVILDDIGNHAKIYREISLMGNRSPGRESYPGDIFYQHAHLLERAGNFKKEAGGGSITALPVIELNLNDFTTLIPTNLMGMTDGHLLFKSSFYFQGKRPSVDISLSVTRVGQQTQNRIHNKFTTKVKQILAEATRLESISRFSAELPFATQLILKQRNQIEELINQPTLTFIPKEVQVILLALPFIKLFQKIDRDFLVKHKDKLIEIFLKDPELVKITNQVFKLEKEEDLINLLETSTPRIEQLIQFPGDTLIKKSESLSVKTPPPPTPTKKQGLLDKIEEAIHKRE